MASALLGLDDVRVAGIEDDLDGGLRVYVVSTAAVVACPGCGTPSAAVQGWVTTRPRDVAFGERAVSLAWFKRRLYCAVTAWLRGHAAGLVVGGGRTVAQAARECGLSWPVVHEAFARQADPVLGQPPSQVAHLGIDEHRRGQPRWRADADTGEYVLLADRWHTCFFHLSGDQGLLGQVEGRTADDAYWLAQASPACGSWSGKSPCTPATGNGRPSGR